MRSASIALPLALTICALGCADEQATLAEEDAAADTSGVETDTLAAETPDDTIDSSISIADTVADSAADDADASETSELDAGDASPDVEDAADVVEDVTVDSTADTTLVEDSTEETDVTLADTSSTDTAADSTVVSPSALWFVDDGNNTIARRLDLPAGTTESFPDLVQMRSFDVSRDGSTFVASANPLYSKREDIWVHDASGTRLLWAGDVLKPGAYSPRPVLSPDAKKVAFVDPTDMLRVASTSGASVVAVGTDSARSLHWSTDGRYVAGNGVFDLSTAPPSAVALDPTCSTRALAISGASVVLYRATCGTATEIRRRDLSVVGDVPKSLVTLAGDVGDTDLSADGKTLAAATAASLLIVDVSGVSPTSTVVVDGKTDFGAIEPQISPDGSHIAFVSYASATTAIVVGPMAGPMKTISDASGVIAPRWSPDSRQLAYYAGPNRLMRIPDVTAPTPTLERTVIFPTPARAPLPLAWTLPPAPSPPPSDAGSEASIDTAPPTSPPVGDIFFTAGGDYDWRLLSSTESGPAGPVFPDWIDVPSMALSASRIAVVAELDGPYRYGVWTIDRATGTRRRITETSSATRVFLSPDSSYVAYTDGDAVHVASETTNRVVATCWYCVPERPWSADGKRLALDHGTHVTIVDAAGVLPDRDVALPTGVDGARYVGFAGSDILVNRYTGTIQSIIRLQDDGTTVGTVPLPTGSSFCISPDGSVAAVPSASGLTLRRTDGLGSPSVATSWTSASISYCAFSPDGTRVAMSGSIEGMGGLFVWSTGATAAIRVADTGSTLLAWSKTSDAIAWMDTDATKRTTSVTTADSPPVVLHTFPFVNWGSTIFWR